MHTFSNISTLRSNISPLYDFYLGEISKLQGKSFMPPQPNNK